MTHIHDECFIVMSEYGIDRMTKRRGNGEGSISRHPKRGLWMARYTVEKGQPHRLETLAGANASRLGATPVGDDRHVARFSRRRVLDRAKLDEVDGAAVPVRFEQRQDIATVHAPPRFRPSWSFRMCCW